MLREMATNPVAIPQYEWQIYYECYDSWWTMPPRICKQLNGALYYKAKVVEYTYLWDLKGPVTYHALFDEVNGYYVKNIRTNYKRPLKAYFPQ